MKLTPLFISVILATNVAKAHNLDKSQEEITTTKVTENIHMLSGEGGNIGVFTGVDGIFMIDDKFAKLSDEIKDEISKISDKPIKYLVNTHFHFDHTGGNENFGKTGSVIVGHDNVRKRLIDGHVIKFFNKEMKPYSDVALPIITYSDKMKFHLNDDDISVIHLKNAHTDGDSVVYFKNENVIHTGDLYFAGLYPFIDNSAGGSVNGLILAIESILKISDDKTKIIPGHGPLSNKSELEDYYKMLVEISSKVAQEKQNGKNLKQIIAMKPTLKFDKNINQKFIPADKFITLVYKGI